jgi:hypothetical protein
MDGTYETCSNLCEKNVSKIVQAGSLSSVGTHLTESENVAEFVLVVLLVFFSKFGQCLVLHF